MFFLCFLRLSLSLYLFILLSITHPVYVGILPMWWNMTILFPKPRTQFQIRHLKSKKKTTASIFFSRSTKTIWTVDILFNPTFCSRYLLKSKWQRRKTPATPTTTDCYRDDAIEQLLIHTIHNDWWTVLWNNCALFIVGQYANCDDGIDTIRFADSE